VGTSSWRWKTVAPPRGLEDCGTSSWHLLAQQQEDCGTSSRAPPRGHLLAAPPRGSTSSWHLLAAALEDCGTSSRALAPPRRKTVAPPRAPPRAPTTFKYVAGIESIKGLTKHLTVHRWERIGEVLGDTFRSHADEVTLAVCAAGAIPYHSRLRTVDMFGLSDPVIAREGIPFKTQPGHERTASFRHLLRRGVNLVLGHPWVVPASWKPDLAQPLDLRRFRLIDARPADLPLGARVIEIPLDRETKLLALYLIANPYVEKAIQENGWQTSAIPF
jgi:hypothetical protein